MESFLYERPSGVAQIYLKSFQFDAIDCILTLKASKWSEHLALRPNFRCIGRKEVKVTYRKQPRSTWTIDTSRMPTSQKGLWGRQPEPLTRKSDPQGIEALIPHGNLEPAHSHYFLPCSKYWIAWSWLHYATTDEMWNSPFVLFIKVYGRESAQNSAFD